MTAKHPSAPALICVSPDGVAFAGHNWHIPSRDDPGPDPLMPQDWNCTRCLCMKPRPPMTYGSLHAASWRDRPGQRWTNLP